MTDKRKVIHRISSIRIYNKELAKKIVAYQKAKPSNKTSTLIEKLLLKHFEVNGE
jgi:hypothetical protein